MIATEFHNGQGLGNQLWCYVTTRIVALKNGYDFGIISADKFKGAGIMNLDFGKQVSGIINHYAESPLYHVPSFSDIRLCDERLTHPTDNTLVEGLMQDAQYVAKHKETIRTWLQINPKYDCREYSNDDICVINFRGGGYARDIHFFLPTTYWKNCIVAMRKINPKFRFIVVSDDPTTAKMFFPNFEIFHWSIGKDYAVIKNAKYLILSNSSFAWFPAWLSQDLKYCIAPKYWARHNISDGYWSLGYNITPGWHYMDRKGTLSEYDTCQQEFTEYISKNSNSFTVIHPSKITLITKIKNVQHIFITLKKEFPTIYVLRKMSVVYTINGMLALRDGIKSIFGIILNSKPSDTPSFSHNDQSVIQSTQGLIVKIKIVLKKLVITQGYY